MSVDNSQVIGTKKIIRGLNIETSLRVHKESNKNIAQRAVKRMIDIVVGICGVILLIPLTIGIYIANRITKDNGPIFYSQDRIGKDGKIFRIYKYRSMVIDADEKLEKYLAENEAAREEYKIHKKLKYDPRVTKVGEFIRKTSLDEFPQFINILKGDMSLVGPRPYLPKEQEEMGMYYSFIVSKKPGLTGFWQVSGRSDVTFNDRLSMDMNYYHKANLKLDIKLIAKTVTSVVKKEGAA